MLYEQGGLYIAKTKDDFRPLIHMRGRGEQKLWEAAFNRIGLIMYSIASKYYNHFSEGQSLLIIIVTPQA
jgi:hypothetical protein